VSPPGPVEQHGGFRCRPLKCAMSRRSRATGTNSNPRWSPRQRFQLRRCRAPRSERARCYQQRIRSPAAFMRSVGNEFASIAKRALGKMHACDALSASEHPCQIELLQFLIVTSSRSSQPQPRRPRARMTPRERSRCAESLERHRNVESRSVKRRMNPMRRAFVRRSALESTCEICS